jgi:hypothetical protein
MGNKKNIIKKPGVKTLSIHHGETFSEETGCVMPPIFSQHLNMVIRAISITPDQVIQTLKF